ncbi:MAG: alpha-galactosidase [Candidatus Latescibacteria bacterium]|nr:alpha-galactosidase [Candidatus Latescibacterota bacterium]
MIAVDFSGHQVEVEYTLNGAKVPEWRMVSEKKGKEALQREYQAGGFTVHLSVAERSPDVHLLSLSVEKGGEEFDLDAFTVRLRSPLLDLHRVWMPQLLGEAQVERLSLQMWGFGYLTAANRCMPFVEFLNREGRNKASIGLVDQTTETVVRGCGNDAEPRAVVEMTRPIEGVTIRTRKHAEQVYLSCAEGSWFDAMGDFARTQAELTGTRLHTLHPNAADPLYCTWYAHGPMVNQEKIMAGLDLVRDLGFRNYVIDEGWFGSGPDASEYRGDYAPNPVKFPDMRKLVDEVHKRGMNIMLWVSPFQIAKKSARYPSMKGYLNKRDRMGELSTFMSIMSPWVTGKITEPDVEERMELCPRTGITEIYVPELVAGLIRDYNLDGLKIDFIDQVSVLPCLADHKHVYATVGEAMDRTMRAFDAAIRAVKKDAIIEFRLPYANLYLRPYATYYRAQDCPWDFDQNRRYCAWIKSFTPGSQPLAEADYISWRPDESVQNVAKAVASSVLYCVPAVGMDFRRLPDSHLRIVKRWLQFYQEHKEAISQGRWQPLEFDPYTSSFAISGARETFVGLFKDVLGTITLEGAAPIPHVYLFNGTGSAYIHTRLAPAEGSYELVVRDLYLEEISRSITKATDGGLNVSLAVPEAGLLELIHRA